MAMIGKVRRMFFREKKSVREIVRLTSLSRNTVRKWLKAAVVEEPKYRRSETPGKLTAFHDAIRQALKVDAHRPRHERRTARALHGQIRAEGYAGGYSRVTDFIRAWRQGEGQSIATTAFVPLAFELGEAFQFDWSEEGLVVGGIYYRIGPSRLDRILACHPESFAVESRNFEAIDSAGWRRRETQHLPERMLPRTKRFDTPFLHPPLSRMHCTRKGAQPARQLA